jgi:Ca2+/Na+ antiporter
MFTSSVGSFVTHVLCLFLFSDLNINLNAASNAFLKHLCYFVFIFLTCRTNRSAKGGKEVDGDDHADI